MSNTLVANKRSGSRRSELTKLRQEGKVPAVVYGYEVENTPIFVNAADFTKLMKEVGRNGVIGLDIEGKKMNAILHEYQQDPLKNTLIHADFLAVDMSQEIEAGVRVELPEDVIGVKNGGVLQVLLHELLVTAVPDKIPEVIEVDASKLDIGETITVGDIRNTVSVTINHEDDEPIANVQPPRVEEDREDGDEAEVQESGAQEAGSGEA